MINATTANRVAEIASTDRNREGTLKLDYIEVGLLVRGEFDSILKEIARNGGRIHFDAVNKGIFISTYYGVKFTGKAYLLNRIVRRLNQLA